MKPSWCLRGSENRSPRLQPCHHSGYNPALRTVAVTKKEKCKTNKVGNCDALQLDNCQTLRQSYRTLITRSIVHQITNSTSCGFGHPDFLHGTHILAIGGHLLALRIFTAHAQKPLFSNFQLKF